MTWRERIEPKLQALGFGVLNPIKQESHVPKIDEVKESYKNRTEKNFQAWLSDYQEVIGQVVDLDLGLIDLDTDILLVWFDDYVNMGAGTHGEITLAKYFGTPVYIICSPGFDPRKIPTWDLGCATKIFTSEDEALEYFKKNVSSDVPKVPIDW